MTIVDHCLVYTSQHHDYWSYDLGILVARATIASTVSARIPSTKWLTFSVDSFQHSLEKGSSCCSYIKAMSNEFHYKNETKSNDCNTENCVIQRIFLHRARQNSSIIHYSRWQYYRSCCLYAVYVVNQKRRVWDSKHLRHCHHRCFFVRSNSFSVWHVSPFTSFTETRGMELTLTFIIEKTERCHCFFLIADAITIQTKPTLVAPFLYNNRNIVCSRGNILWKWERKAGARQRRRRRQHDEQSWAKGRGHPIHPPTPTKRLLLQIIQMDTMKISHKLRMSSLEKVHHRQNHPWLAHHSR